MDYIQRYLFGETDDRERNPFSGSGYNQIDNFEDAPIFSFKRRSDGNIYPSTPSNQVQSDIVFKVFSGTSGKMALGMGILLLTFAFYSRGDRGQKSLEIEVADKAKIIPVVNKPNAVSNSETGPLFWAHFANPIVSNKDFAIYGKFEIPDSNQITFTLTTTSKPEGVNDICDSKINNPWTENKGACFISSQSQPYPYKISAPINCDIIRWNEEGKRTLKFSEPIENLHIAIASLNEKFLFSQDFSIISDSSQIDCPLGKGSFEKATKNCGLFGDGVSCIQLSAKSGAPSGVIKFTGSIKTFTFFQPSTDSNGMQLGILHDKTVNVISTPNNVNPNPNPNPSISSSPPPPPPPTSTTVNPPKKDPKPSVSVGSKDEDIMCEMSSSLDLPKQIVGWSCNSNKALVPTCQWSGVECDPTSRVVAIEITSKSVRGTLPPSIDKLNALTRLDLHDNLLSGTIPPNIAKIKTLREIILGDNKLINGIPPKIGRMPNLLTLSLNNNSLSGKLPYLFDKPPFQITSIDISGNHITGQIPLTFGKISSLKSLALNGNSLTGSIPYQFCDNVENLNHLDVRKNKLTCIPKCLSSSPALLADQLQSC